ncbi:MAG: efflux RND transporter periplasmic adaptor subunit [Phycisphaeraceae bacterium]|nr:efflux RND transporter periplasmic adaptor subunit [Phycisphaeraceae bacterium]
MNKIILIPSLVLMTSMFPATGCGRAESMSSPTPAGATHDPGHNEHTDGEYERDEHAHDEHEDDQAGRGSDDDDQVRLSDEAIERSGIRTEPVQSRVLVGEVVAPARVTFNLERMAHVGSPLAGRVHEIPARVGDTVEKNDPLLVVQSPELGEAQSDYLLKRMAMDTAAPAVELARVALDRARTLYEESQGIALAEVQRREAELRAAQGGLLAARAQATAAENLLHMMGMDQDAVRALATTGEIDPYYMVRAPIAGLVIEREATLGELVGPDREALLVLADMRTLWVLADVPESQVNRVTVGATARVTVPAMGNASLEGTVTSIAARLDPATRTAPVRIEVRGDAAGLRPGMFAQAVIVGAGAEGEHAATPAVPEDAAQWIEGRTVVFVPVRGEPNTFATRSVDLGEPVGGMAPVRSGLAEGELFVADGSFILKAEMGKAGAAHEH